MKQYLLLIMVFFLASSSYAQITEDKSLTYNPDGFVATEKTTLSNLDDVTRYYQYPKDYGLPAVYSCGTIPTPTQGLIQLIAANNIDVPVETYSVLHKYGTSTTEVTEGVLTTFQANGYPYQVYKIESAIPIATFTPSHYDATTCGLDMDLHYALQETYTKYDNYGNLLEKNTRGNKNISFIYSYKGAYKIAEVDNAANNQIAYTSFETTDGGGWNYTPSGVLSLSSGSLIAGKNVYIIDYGAISNLNALPLGDYVVSFWRKAYTTPPPIPIVRLLLTGSSPTDNAVIGATINGWTYEEHHIKNITGLTISGNGDYIDELRLYPANAEMITYGYTPLVGVTYSCDVASHFNYYEYDDLNRPTIVRDQNGNIKKKIDYRVQQAE